jgi:hypothetical protein
MKVLRASYRNKIQTPSGFLSCFVGSALRSSPLTQVVSSNIIVKES